MNDKFKPTQSNVCRDLEDQVSRLLNVAKKVAGKKQKSVNSLTAMTGDRSLHPLVRDLAETIALMSVEIEAREYRVELIIDDLLKKQADLEQAMHDALTGLPNRAIFHEHLNKFFEAAVRNKKPLAVVFIDLDNFKPINDSLGHDAGDELLVMVGKRILKSIRSSDVAARLGGDEFALILDQFSSKKEALLVCNRVLEELKTPFPLKAGEVSIGGSIGVSFFPGDADNPTSLLKSADMAMYSAKSKGRNQIRCYKP